MSRGALSSRILTGRRFPAIRNPAASFTVDNSVGGSGSTYIELRLSHPLVQVLQRIGFPIKLFRERFRSI